MGQNVDFRCWLVSTVVLLACCSGCTICASPDLETYTATGGLWQRTNPTHGRVGSPFSAAGVRVGMPASPTLAPELEEVPPGDAEPDEAASAPSEEQIPADDLQPPETMEPAPKPKDLRDLELEDIREQLRPRNDASGLPDPVQEISPEA